VEDDTPTQSELKVHLSSDAVQASDPSERTPKGRKRRKSNLNWVTVEKYLRKKNKQDHLQQQQQQQ